MPCASIWPPRQFLHGVIATSAAGAADADRRRIDLRSGPRPAPSSPRVRRSPAFAAQRESVTCAASSTGVLAAVARASARRGERIVTSAAPAAAMAARSSARSRFRRRGAARSPALHHRLPPARRLPARRRQRRLGASATQHDGVKRHHRVGADAAADRRYRCAAPSGSSSIGA